MAGVPKFQEDTNGLLQQAAAREGKRRKPPPRYGQVSALRRSDSALLRDHHALGSSTDRGPARLWFSPRHQRVRAHMR